MSDNLDNIMESIKSKIRNCNNTISIFDTKDYVLLSDVESSLNNRFSTYVVDHEELDNGSCTYFTNAVNENMAVGNFIVENPQGTWLSVYKLME